MNVRSRTLLLAVAAASAVAVPGAYATLDGTPALQALAPVVGLQVYADVDSTLCTSSFQALPDGGYDAVYLCAGRNLHADADTGATPVAATSNGTQVHLYVQRCDLERGCEFTAHSDSLSTDEFDVAPDLSSGAVHADVDGCRVDLDLTATEALQDGSEIYRNLDTDPSDIFFQAHAEEALHRASRPAGTVCGIAVTSDATGALAHTVEAQALLRAQPGVDD